jgi:hypothetical protein
MRWRCLNPRLEPMSISRSRIGAEHSVYAKFRRLCTDSLIFDTVRESLLELPHRFRASHTGFIHLQDKTL